MEPFARTTTDFFESVRFAAGLVLIGGAIVVGQTLALLEELMSGSSLRRTSPA